MKEGFALAESGIEVEVLGAWFDSGLKARDQMILQQAPFGFTPVVDFTESRMFASLGRQVSRIRSKLGAVAFRFGRVESRWQFSLVSGALRAAALTRPAHLYIAHSEGGMLIARDLLARGARVGADLEDWFSEDLLPEVRRERPIGMLRRLERTLLHRGAHASCPSLAMSSALVGAFGCRPPRVIYNAFPWSDRGGLRGDWTDRRDPGVPSLHWYSQTVGRGRGLEDLFAALPHLSRPVEVHLRGQPMKGFEAWLGEQVPAGWHDRVIVHPLVSNEELLSRIAEHDIGFAGEMQYSRSRDLTITNKILHYLLAGLAVVASDTAGQREVAQLACAGGSGTEPVLLYPSGDSRELAAQINRLLESKERLAAAKAAALVAAERTFCWERQAPVLVDSVRAAITSGGDRPVRA